MTRAERIRGWTRPSVRALKPYYKAPLEGDPLRLDQNTNLYGPSPALARVDAAQLDQTQYPTRDSDDLLAALAGLHGLDESNFVVGNGGDEILDIVTKAFTAPKQVLATPSPSYSLYPFYAALHDLRLRRVPLRGGFRIDVDGLLATGAALTIVASPNNPTGNAAARPELERLVRKSDGIVVVDEAYTEYAGEEGSMLASVEEHDNLVVMRTLSKAYGLAGLRVGYAAANRELMAQLRLVKSPFNLDGYAEAVAIEALRDQDWLRDQVARTIEERERLAGRLAKLGFRVHPSDANFLLTDCPDDPGIILDGLRRRGILARAFPGADGLEHAVRFTVGQPAHTDQLCAALAQILEVPA